MQDTCIHPEPSSMHNRNTTLVRMRTQNNKNDRMFDRDEKWVTQNLLQKVREISRKKRLIQMLISDIFEFDAQGYFLSLKIKVGQEAVCYA
jgi:hypothetical protein